MFKRLLVLGTLAFPCFAHCQVSVGSLLRESVDFERLTRLPSPGYSLAQASSYDRASVAPGQESWFANADWGKYLRTEQRDGRNEYVMADLKGPGAVVRIWSANPGGTVRFYFDGEETPRIEAKTRDLLSGKYKFMAAPFGYEALRAVNLYFPLPYEKSLKVTVDDTDDNAAARMYYHVGYRTYAAGTPVQTYDESLVAGIFKEVAPSDGGSQVSEIVTRRNYAIPAGKSETFMLSRDRPSAIQRLVIKPLRPRLPASKRWSDPRQMHRVLRGLRLVMDFDGEKTIDVPASDFFGSPPTGAPYWTLPMEVTVDGSMVCYFWMPFQRQASITLINENSITAFGDLVVADSEYGWREDSLYFHAQWSAYRGSTRPMRDFNVLDTKGAGQYVGTTLFVANPVGEWWGEGDEKIFVDGESFPSTFGTGTEDYFGYAWSDPRPYSGIAYHSQPNAGTPGNYGLISNNRFHVLDSVPFRTSLKFDLEIWHWKETDATLAATAYWYARPGSQGPRMADASLLDVPELTPKKPVEGAIEGEAMKVVATSGGQTEIQGGFFEPSGGQHLWWIDAKDGDTLTLEFTVQEAGSFSVAGNFCNAIDYGVHSLTINGSPAGEFDFFNDGIKWSLRDLGTHALRKGSNLIIVKSVGSNPLSKPARRMFGLDYLLLEKVGA